MYAIWVQGLLRLQDSCISGLGFCRFFGHKLESKDARKGC